MKILIIAAFYPPDNTIGAQRPASWAKYWGLAGHQVDVLTTSKEDRVISGDNITVHTIEASSIYFLIKKVYRLIFKRNSVPQQNDKNTSTTSQSSHKRIKKFLNQILEKLKSKGIGTSTRMPDPFDFWIRPAKKWIFNHEEPWDLIISTFGPYATHLIALDAYKKKKSKYWISDFRDLWAGSHLTSGVFPFNFIESYYEKKIIHSSTLTTIVSEPLQQLLLSKYPNAQILTIENGYETSDIDKLEKESFFEDTSQYRISYTGSIYKGRRDPTPLFKAIALLRDAKFLKIFDFKVIFMGPQMNWIEELAQHFAVTDNVQIYPSGSREESLRLQRDSDMLLFLETENDETPGVLTGKLFEYLSSNTPIMSIGLDDNTTAGKLIKKANAGINLGNDVNKIVDALKSILLPTSKHNFTPNQKIIKYYTRENLAAKMLDTIK